MSHKYVTHAAKTGPVGGVVPIAPCVGGILLPGRQNEGPPQVPRNKIHRGRCGRSPYCWRAGTDCVGIPFCQAFRFWFRGLGETRTATAISPDRPQRRPCRWKPSQGSSPKFSLNFCPFYFLSIYEFDSQFDPARQRSAVATISSSSVFSVSSVRDIFMRCLARSRSSRPSGCLRQAARPAPAGTCLAFASTSTTRRRGGAGGRWHRFRVRARG